MKKKVLVIAIMFAMIFAFSACGGGEGSSDSQDSGQAEAGIMGESADLISSDAGELKFIGIQKADPKLVEEENAYVFIYEFTNLKDDPAQCQSAFWLQYFQNNTEITANSLTYFSEAKEQYDLVQAFYNEALKDGVVRFGQIVLPQDDSAVTIMAKEQNNQDHYETIEVSLSDGSVTGGESKGSGDSAEAADIDPMLQGDWVLEETNTFHFDNGAVSFSADGGKEFSGEYTINQDTSEIDCVVHDSGQDTKFHLPYEIKDGTLHLYNNHGSEMIRQ